MTKKRQTAFFTGDDVTFFIDYHCELCLKPVKEWVNIDKYGNFDSDIYVDEHGDLSGLLCPDCAEKYYNVN